MFFPSTPISFSVELTYACPNSCKGCANVWNENHRENLKDWKRVFDRIAPPPHRRKYAELIRITGGEPTLHKDFPQIIDYIDDFGIAYAIFTSGRWHRDVIATCKNRKNLVGLLMSLYGSTATTHNDFVQTDHAFEETCANIQRATTAGIEVFTNTVLTQDTCAQVGDIIALSQNLGANYAIFNRYIGLPHSVEPQEAILREAISDIEQYQRQGVHCRLGNCVPPCFIENSSEGANSGIEHCVISPQGGVRPDSTTNYALGNLFEQSIETIWQSESAQRYRTSLSEGCLQCIALPQCRGGYRQLTTDYQFAPDPLMRQPVSQIPSCLVKLNLQWKPTPLFKIRTESFGYLLTRYNYSIPATHEAYPLLTAIDGKKTLAQLKARFGEDSLELMGYLYQNGFVL